MCVNSHTAIYHEIGLKTKFYTNYKKMANSQRAEENNQSEPPVGLME
jgi:hypothetical protein